MTVEFVNEIARNALYTIIRTSAPVLLISLSIGLIVSIFQTVTSIQEQTLTFVPKIVCVFLGLMLFGHWMLQQMIEFTIQLWQNFAFYIR